MRSGRKTDHSRTFIIQRADNAPKNPKIKDVVEEIPSFRCKPRTETVIPNYCKCLSEVTTTITSTH